jgi:hypothetical protein
MSEEPGTTSTLPADSAKSSVLEEEKKSDQESGGTTGTAAKEAPIPIINPGFRGLFSLKSKNMSAKDRFSQKAQDYLESHKMAIYLQDAIKIILDRREDKPLDLLNE